MNNRLRISQHCWNKRLRIPHHWRITIVILPIVKIVLKLFICSICHVKLKIILILFFFIKQLSYSMWFCNRLEHCFIVIIRSKFKQIFIIVNFIFYLLLKLPELFFQPFIPPVERQIKRLGICVHLISVRILKIICIEVFGMDHLDC